MGDAIDLNKTEGRRREKTALEYMGDHPDGKFCSRCGAEVPGAQGVACLCWHCLDLLARLRQGGYFNQRQPPDRACADCGRERRAGKRFCDPCAAKRARERKRKWARSKRSSGTMAL
ncbi:MAG TPA: hypothetical protein VMW24_06060 [Sedimentisphaerales bacterium]|nr:hypothetical protein [Sedimentisphaerales bacterium]